MRFFRSIGTIHTPFISTEGMPIQSRGAAGVKGTVVLKKKYTEGLQDLDGFSHIFLIYRFHKSKGYNLLVTPFLDTVKRGVFSTRAPKRPNPIGISVVRLLKVEGNILEIENADMLDGTPLLDIKPYVPDFDIHTVEREGWTAENISRLGEIRSDGRFK